MAEPKRDKTYIPFFGCMISIKYPQFEASIRKTLPALGITLKDVEGFTCCPDPIYFKASDKLTWMSVAARNLCLAEEAGHDIITCCSGCTATLSEVRHHLNEDPELKRQVNERLARVGKEYKGTVRVRHIVTVVRDDIGIDVLKQTVKQPLTGLDVAIHYGCHLLKPSKIMQVDDPDRPRILEDLIEAVGARPVKHKEHLQCCGKACMNEQMPPKMTYDILKGIQELGADCMGLICPTCFDEFDLGQLKLARIFKERLDVPVVYYFQLLGLAQGLSPEDMGLGRHKISVKAVTEKVSEPAALGGAT